MSKNNKIKILCVVLALFALVSTVAVFATESATESASSGTSISDIFGSDYSDMVTASQAGINGYNAATTNDLTSAAQTLFAFGMYIIQLVYSATLILTSVILVYSIIKYARSGGKPKMKEESKNAIMVGLVIIAILAALPLIYMIIVNVLNAFG